MDGSGLPGSLPSLSGRFDPLRSVPKPVPSAGPLRFIFAATEPPLGSSPMVQATRIPVADIFVTSGFPDFTFVAPVVYPRLVNALRQRAGGVVVEGPSGIGKSVAVTRAIEEIGDGLGPVTVMSARDSTQRAAIKRVAEEKPDGT